ncbi:MAG: DUF4347 domain-containing protein, partial [Planctomycetales bacterium]|nr:DUF4347 domain-containing protein [Planctomycetales bacterium]
MKNSNNAPIHNDGHDNRRLMEILEDRVLFDAVPDALNVLDQIQPEELLVETHESVAQTTSAHESTHTERHEIVFIDGAIEDADKLLAQILLERADQSLELHILDETSDGVQQIAEVLASRKNVDAIHILSHGSQAELQLGTARLTADSMTGQYAEALNSINVALADDADILVYGCKFGEGAAGQQAAQLLASITGADIATSTDDTGNVSRGGDWELERVIGELDSEVIVSAELAASWNVLLATPAMEFFVTLDEQGIYDANEKILNEGLHGNVTQQIQTTIGIVANNDSTIIYYDHHEDGYEADLGNPVQSTTEIWGDGDISNGAAPGVTTNAGDVLNAGDFVVLTNLVDLTSPPTPASPLYDGTDRFASESSLAVTRGAWHTFPGTPLAGTTEVAEVGRWGTEYVSPVGEDTALGTLYEYTGMFIIAAADNTNVSVDVNADGDFSDPVDVVTTLSQGESLHIDGGVLQGARVVASDAVGVNLITGDRDSSVDSRWYMLRPLADWSNSYISPAGSVAAAGPAAIIVYNPHATDLDVDIETLAGTVTRTVTAGGTFVETLSVEIPNSAARAVSTDGRTFYAAMAMDADATHTTYDWGYSLLPEDALTEMVLGGWMPGSSDLTQNGSPVWVAANSDTTLYVDYDGDSSTGALIDPFGR